MRNFILKFNELKQYQTLAEISENISIFAYEKSSYFLLAFLLFMPVGVMTLSPFIENNLNMLMYVWGLFVGDVGIVILIWMEWFILKKSYVKKRYDYLFFSGMVIWLSLSTFVHRHETIVWLGDRYRHEGFFMFLAYSGICFISTILLQEKYRRQLLYLFITVSFIMSTLTILDYNGVKIPLFSEKRSGYSAIFHQFNHFGYFLLMSGMCAAGLFIIEKKSKLKIYAIIVFFVIVSTLIINDTFGCYLGVLFGLLFLPFGFSLVNKKFKLKYVMPLVLFGLITVAMNQITGTVGNNMSILSKDINKIVIQDETSGSAGTGRWVLWINAVKFIKDKPLFGHGLDNLGELYDLLGVGTDRPHNEYLQYAAHLGVPALIFYLCGIGSIFMKAYKNRMNLTDTTLVALGVVAAYLVSACFGNTMYYTTPYFMMLLGMATNSGKSNSLEEELAN